MSTNGALPLLAIDMRMMRASGIGRYLRQVVPLVRRDASGFRMALLGDPEEMSALGLDGRENGQVTTLHACRAPIYSAREQLALPRAAPADAGGFWSPHYNFPVFARSKLVVTVHDALHLARPEYVRGAHRRFYARAMFGQLRRQADAIICDSRFTADELTRHAGVDHRRIEVIHLGVDEKWFHLRSAERPHPRPYFLYVGNVKPHKNLPRLIEAIASLAGELPHDLVIVGRKEGLLGGDERVAARGAELGGRVSFTGEVDDRALEAHVSHAEALVLPSRYEGFGLPALEAMAAGCPVVASTAASLPEVCGGAALYFDPESPVELAGQLRRIVRDRVRREELIAAGRERARGFTWERCATRTREVLERALEVT